MATSKIRKSNRNVISAKKVFGIILLVLGIFMLLFSCIPSFLNLGKFFQGVFGVLVYPISLLLTLVGIALIKDFSYTLNRKYVAYLTISFICLLTLLHVIFTTNTLYDKTTKLSQMGEYLDVCYSMSKGITVGGVFLGIFAYILRTLLSLVGAYAFLGVFATVFIGLTIDYLIYSKKKETRREKLTQEQTYKKIEADENLFASDEERYSFSNKKNSKPPVFPGWEEEEKEEQSIEKIEPLFETTDDKIDKILETDTNISFSFNDIEEKEEPEAQTENKERDNARNVLFGTGKPDYDSVSYKKPEEVSNEPKSAREILGLDKTPNVPNIFDRSSEERDAWRRQYASKPLAFNEEEEQKLEQNKITETEKEENIVSPNQNDDGSIRTSWGTYRPTSSLNSNMSVDAVNQNSRINRRDGGLNVNTQATQEKKPTEPIFNNNFIERSNRIRESREKTSISNFNRLSENEESTEFTSRLTSQDNSRLRSGDLLANASNLGIENKKKEEEPSFTSIVENSRRIPEKEPEVKIEPGKVEKINFIDQISSKYTPPPTTILNVVKEEKVDYSQEYREKSAILERTLSNFKIPAKVINVVRGPKVTRYELSMPSGIPVSKVLSYDKDMSMNLATRSGVRIEAPIPGKNAFGVEVENSKASMVGFRELVESPEFKNFKTPLPVAIGKNISGETIIKDLGKMVHLLVAGSTGSGKSVFLHSLIMSLMYKLSPDELRFIMIDPKRVEFNRYNRMPHLMLPEVVTECSKAINALNWAVKEMERRYDLLMKNECQKLEQFNNCDAVKRGEEKKLPYLVIVVDELAELMGVAAKEAESKIQRITQLGRASGIHMVIATQRPSVDVVTGVIKNNLPTRVAFSLTSAVDSQTIINQGGAEKLLGQGDMLLMAQDSNQLVRLQAAYVSDDEIKKVLTFIKDHNMCVYDEEIQKSIYAEPEKEEPSSDDFASGGGGNNEDRMDELMPQALKLVMKNGKASISMIQRRFSVGYARAARIIDQMETRGFIDGGLGNKPRDVKISIEEYNELFGDFDSE